MAPPFNATPSSHKRHSQTTTTTEDSGTVSCQRYPLNFHGDPVTPWDTLLLHGLIGLEADDKAFLWLNSISYANLDFLREARASPPVSAAVKLEQHLTNVDFSVSQGISWRVMVPDQGLNMVQKGSKKVTQRLGCFRRRMWMCQRKKDLANKIALVWRASKKYN